MPVQITRGAVRGGTYRDSVFLMRVTSRLRIRCGIEHAEVLMGTPNNLKLLCDQGLLTGEIADEQPGPSDLVIAVQGKTGAVEEALREALDLIDGRSTLNDTSRDASSAGQPVVRGISEAVEVLPAANLALISVPGPHVRSEAMAALRRNLNLLIFSSNVSIDDEVAIKREAAMRGLLVMGPDCGTAMFRKAGLAFANVVRSGPVGLIGAAGTGLQQVSTLVHLAGSGVSHIIGTGSQDVSLEVGGLTMLAGLDLLKVDPATEVVVIVTKPPHPETAKRILDRARLIQKPVVACFLGVKPVMVRDLGAVYAATLEEAALQAVSLAEGKNVDEVGAVIASAGGRREHMIDGEAQQLADDQRFVRGLYCGGTFAVEAALVLEPLLGAVSGNFHATGIQRLNDPRTSVGHTILDLGDETFTRGRPHPMIEPVMREEQILLAAADRSVGVIVMDFVLGHVAHPDPAGAVAQTLRTARQSAAKGGRHLSIIATMCGTDQDPQGLDDQSRILEEVGAVVMRSNAQTAQIAADILLRRRP